MANPENSIKKLILYYIRDWHTKNEIVSYLEQNNFAVNERQLRKIIRDLIFAGMPITSESKGKLRGYKLETDPRKLYNNAERLKRRAIKIMERAAKLEKIISDIRDGKLF